MKEIVQKILETEREVREAIDRAHGDAQRIVHEAEARSRQIEDEYRQKATHEAQEIVERMKAEAEAERAKRIGSVQSGSADLIRAKRPEIARSADRVIKLILGVDRR